MSRVMLSANEIEALVLKAARGGGVPLGYAEDLAAASNHLDMDALEHCPCSGAVPVSQALPTALDQLRAGAGPQEVMAQACLVRAYVAALAELTGQEVAWVQTDSGAVLESVEISSVRPAPLGRRSIPAPLFEHLTEQAALTLVPETEASRVGGAGAGLTDND